MKVSHNVVLGILAILTAAVIPGYAQSSAWDFVYDGDALPEQIVADGGTDWQPREGETNGRPKYESILTSSEAQAGGIWSRRDDNSDDPDAPDASGWARGYLFGTDIYDQWTGKMTLVLRVKDLGTTSQKSVIDITTVDADTNYWTLGHVIAGDEGVAGWEFGQTDDGRNGNGLSDIRTGGYNEWAIIRINIVDTTAGDGKSRIRAWQDGNLVYDAIRGDDITDIGEIAFRRTSGGGEQHMEIDWIRMSFADAYAPGTGPSTPNGEDDETFWDFVYYGNELPQTIVDSGRTSWQPQEGGINGRPIYESIVISDEAQIGGLWSRLDDNSEDPDAPGAEGWARGYLFGTDIYDQWTGRMTLVVRMKDLGTGSQKSVIDISNATADYWTLGHVAAGDEGVAGWEFGQTNDGRNGNDANGITDVRVGGYNTFSILRITIVDDTPGDGMSTVKGYKDGILVYESDRTDDIAAGDFSNIAFRRTSGGSDQKMEIDWVMMKFGNAWVPGSGALTPAGLMDGAGANIVNLPSTGLVDGAIGADTRGLLRSVHDASQGAGLNDLFEVDANNVPTKLSLFYLGFDAIRDIEVAANDKGVLTGVLALDKFAGVHTYSVADPGDEVSGPGVPSDPPRIDYQQSVAEYNAANPGNAVGLPFFGGFDASGAFMGMTLTDYNYTASETGGDNAIARDIEVAVDWHTATNAFQGYYILDAFGGIHYINNAEVMAYLALPANNDVLATKVTDSNGNPIVQEPVGYQNFMQFFGFKPKYNQNYVGANPTDEDLQRAGAPYFYNQPIARDLEVLTRFDSITAPDGTDLVTESMTRYSNAEAAGIAVDNLFTSIKMDPDRKLPTSPKFTPKVAVTNGYAVLDAFGGVHSLLEDKTGNPIPAPWETVEKGTMDPDADAPYFFTLDLAVDLEILPNGNGFALLTRLGEVFFVAGSSVSEADKEALEDMASDLPFFGFDAARDLTLVAGDDGKVAGMYVVDRFGTVHSVGQVPALPSRVLYFPSGNALDLELSPYSRITDAQ